jgi:hypothetical protein
MRVAALRQRNSGRSRRIIAGAAPSRRPYLQAATLPTSLAVARPAIRCLPPGAPGTARPSLPPGGVEGEPPSERELGRGEHVLLLTWQCRGNLRVQGQSWARRPPLSSM